MPVAGLAAMLAASLQPAAAQPVEAPFAPAYHPFSSDVEAAERGCLKLCIRDYSPCDPPRYKQADARCSPRHD